MNVPSTAPDLGSSDPGRELQSLHFFLFCLFVVVVAVVLRPHCAACRILVPRPGIEPTNPCSGSMESQPLDHQGSSRSPPSCLSTLNFLQSRESVQMGDKWKETRVPRHPPPSGPATPQQHHPGHSLAFTQALQCPGCVRNLITVLLSLFYKLGN